MTIADKQKKLLIFHLDFNYVNLQKDYIKNWLHILSDLGYNAILWEIEDKVRWENCPECVWPEAMSKKEFSDLLDYSRSLGLEPIPLLQTIGHGEYVLKHKKYAGLREQKSRIDCYCTSNPAVKKLLSAFISEYLDLFGKIKYFHLGGDEAYVFGTCPKCRAAIKNSSPSQVYSRHITELAAPLLKKGIVPGVWCDMLLHYPEDISAVPRDFIIWDWNYWSNFDSGEIRIWGQSDMIGNLGKLEKFKAVFPEIFKNKINQFYTTDFLKNRGYEVILSSASRSSGDTVFFPNSKIHISNIIDAAKKTKTSGILGNCVTSWAIRLNSYETQTHLLCLAPLAFKNQRLSREQILGISLENFFASGSSKIPAWIYSLSERIPLAHHRVTGIQWNTLKDGSLPGSNYLASVFSVMKRKNSGGINEWEHEWKNLDRKIKHLSETDQELTRYTLKAGRNFHILSDINVSGQIMKEHSLLMKLFYEKKYRGLAAQLFFLKQMFCAYRRRSETPLSAEKNASLVYDPLINLVRRTA